MRLWTIHPKHLDARGLTALWRESLLAKKVLSGKTKGYIHHPQLIRFRYAGCPVRHIEQYLRVVFEESERRGYKFDRAKIGRTRKYPKIRTTKNQLLFEWDHFKKKVRLRDAVHSKTIAGVAIPEAHPIFRIVGGPIESWEKTRRPPSA